MQRPKNRLNVDITLDQSLEVFAAYNSSMYKLSGKNGDYVTKNQDDIQDANCDDLVPADAGTIIAKEITNWLQSQKFSSLWMSTTRLAQPTPCQASQLLRHLKCHNPFQFRPQSDPTTYETVVRLVALQLLAACYTLSPSPNATHVSLLQQRKATDPMKAQGAFSDYHSPPASGYLALPYQEMAHGLGLYTGPLIKEKLVDHVRNQRRWQKYPYERTPLFAGSGWTDGPPPSATHAEWRKSISRASSSSSEDTEPGFFSKLICQAAIPKSYRRKHNTMFFSRLSLRSKKRKVSEAEYEHDQQDEQQSSPQDFSAQSVQRIPSVFRLRHTQSAPRIVVEEETSIRMSLGAMRHSSDPSIGSPLEYPFQIPEIRRVSVTTSGSRRPDSSAGGSVRACGRGDLIAAHDYFDDTPDTPYTPRKQQRQWKTPRWRHKYTGTDSLPETATSEQQDPMNDYFGQVYAGENNPDEHDDEVATREHDDAGPAIHDDPRLQKMLGNLGIQSSEADSSDSDIKQAKKRKSIHESSSTAVEVAKLFRVKTEDREDLY